MLIYLKLNPLKKVKMKGLNKIVLLFLAVLIFSCSTVKESNNHWFRDINVCKKLQSKVLIYPVFVEEKKGFKWSTEDVAEFMDSLALAVDWIKYKADKNKIQLEIISENHPKVIVKGLPAENIKETDKLFEASSGFEKINKHYDGIAKLVGVSIKKQETIKPFVEKFNNKERLCAKLRNIYQVESVVLLFVHKSEAMDNVYFTMNSLTNENVEFAVTSINNPTLIAAQILEMFGAATLLYSLEKKSEEKSAKYVKDNFPLDIMGNPLSNINTLDIGKYTQYLIGWHNDFLPEYKTMTSSKLIIVKK